MVFALTDAEEPVDPTLDQRSHDLLSALGQTFEVDVFGGENDVPAARLAVGKAAADRLVTLKLAKYTDEGRTRIAITNAGRYWAAHGGYFAFLKEEPPGTGGGGRGRNPEAEALRFEYMRLRLNTFWWTFGLSIAGFVISLISLAVAFLYAERFIR